MRVSIVIPAYNVSQYIEQAIQSCIAQTHPDLEIFILDDGSSDNTVEVAKMTAAQAEVPIEVVALSHQGAPVTRNEGLALSQGEFIQFLDADDHIDPEKIAHQLMLVESSGENRADVVAGACEIVTETGEPWHTVSPDSEDIWFLLSAALLGRTSSNLWRRQALIECGGWNIFLTSNQEYDLIYRLLLGGSEVIRDTVVHTTKVRRDSGAIWQDSIENYQGWLSLHERIIRHLQRISPLPESTLELIFQDIHEFCSGFLAQEVSQAFAKHVHRSLIPADFAVEGRSAFELFEEKTEELVNLEKDPWLKR